MNKYLYPQIIQGGMAMYISNWWLAKVVSKLGQLGTVSGVSLEKAMVLILQMGDSGGHLRRALSSFPFPDVSGMVLKEYFVDGGVKKGSAMKNSPRFTIKPSEFLISLTVCANYAFMWLAKEGHKNPVSVNFLEKIAMPHLYAIFGVMLAGGDCITMGAGIPWQVPEVLSNFADGKEAKYKVPVIGENIKEYVMSFDPLQFFGSDLKKVLPLKMPWFLPIISSNALASVLMKKLPKGSIHGFVVEGKEAAGHNAPPRNKKEYCEKDKVNHDDIKDLGLPFWLGGGYASPGGLVRARLAGAEGIQVGSIFALCNDSAMNPEIRRRARYLGFRGELKVRTDMLISSSGYPFKVAELDGTISDPIIYKSRVCTCKHGALVQLYETREGAIGYRCTGESVDTYVMKGGNIDETIGRGCLCCGLFSNTEITDDSTEPPIVTLGDDLGFLRHLMVDAHSSYSASDAIRYLLRNSL
ncbi:MAG: nitronate monooxygenase [Minisyncoccia bacterium]